MIITILSDSPFLPTGYSNQSKLLAKYFRSKGHEVHYLANAFAGTTVAYAKLPDGTEFDYKIYGEMKHEYFKSTMSKHLKKTKSDVFIILLDTFMLYPWFLDIDTSPAKTFFWFPTDGGGGLPRGCEQILRKVECAVAMSKFGKKQVKDYHNLDTEYIPLGTEADRFYKLPEEQRIELRNKWGLNDKFVIGVVARNQPRKHLDRMIKTMKLVSEKIPNAILFLHMDPNDPANPMFSLSSIIKKHNLENRVMFTGMQAHKGFDWNQMNEIYNVMDCFFLSTSGEGFGIPIIEAMSCEVPVVATGYTTTEELVILPGAGFGVKLTGVDDIKLFEKSSQDYDSLSENGTITGSWEVERGFIDIKDACDKICELYKKPELRKTMGANGRAAVMKEYDFNKHVGPVFEKLISK